MTLQGTEIPELFLGIDVGYSKIRHSTGLCLLVLQEATARWECLNTGTEAADRLGALRSLVPRGAILRGVGIDGPLTSGLRIVGHYRSAEALLSRGVFCRRGKPGQTSAPVGQHLHQHATKLAQLTLDLEKEGYITIVQNSLPQPLDSRCLLETFPNLFLGVLLPEGRFPLPLRRDASDRFWEQSINGGYLESLVDILADGVRLARPLSSVTNHDCRAALVCALAALAVDRGCYVAVGDPVDGDIILPPLEAWGPGEHGQPWAEAVLRENLFSVRQNRRGYPNHGKARLLRNGEEWQ